MTRSVKNSKKLPCFENVNMFTKLQESINQVSRPLNLGRRKQLTRHPFLHTLTSKTVSQIFGTCVCRFFNKRVKLKKEKKQNCPRKKRHNFLMRGIIKIRRHGFVGERFDNILSEFQPICSRGCRLGTRNARTTRLFFTFEKQRKNKICGIRVLRDYHTRGETTEESTFYKTIGL